MKSDATVLPHLLFNTRANTRGSSYKLLNHTFHYDLQKTDAIHTASLEVSENVAKSNTNLITKQKTM